MYIQRGSVLRFYSQCESVLQYMNRYMYTVGTKLNILQVWTSIFGALQSLFIVSSHAAHVQYCTCDVHVHCSYNMP